MPKFVRRFLAILAGVGFTLFILLLALDPRHSDARDQLPEPAHGSRPTLPDALET
ncbi:MAG: hypothetical protein JRH19_23580 [Deltaproteobacteria bacterium]|nr:hypothetical protein [Deltaproteobacteria bacterium]